MIKKLKSNSGESLAEVLIAVLVLSFGVLMLATMIRTAWNIVNREETAFKAYISDKNKFEVVDDSVDSNERTAIISDEDNNIVTSIPIIIYSREVDPGIYFYRYERIGGD